MSSLQTSSLSVATIYCLLSVLIVTLTTTITCQQQVDHPSRILDYYSTPYAEAHIKPHDPFSSSWNFYCNLPGIGPQDYASVNYGSDIRTWWSGSDNYFEVGIQGGDTGYIVDLGEESDIRSQYGISNNVAYVFSSIGFKDNQLQLVKSATSKDATYVPLNGTVIQALFQQQSYGNKLPIRLGHVYLVRITEGASDTRIISKFKVTMTAPSDNSGKLQLITLRHQTLYVKKSGSGNDCRNVNVNGGDQSVFLKMDSNVALGVIALLTAIAAVVISLIALIGFIIRGKRQNYQTTY
ncbi:hypothetical protein ABK040_011862 [Willaertia magna]